MKTFKKDKQGLYFQGEFKSASYQDAIKEVYQLDEVPSGFCINADHKANGYSIVDSDGIQHIYDLNAVEFYDNFMNLE